MLVLVDGNHMASRARFASKEELRTSDGRISTVVYVFLRSLGYTLDTLASTWRDVIVVWDGGRAEWRKELYPEYKKRKEDTEEDKEAKKAYFAQLEAIHENFLPSLGIQSIKIRGEEADDIISILAHRINKFIVIVSGDHDYHQLVSNKVVVFAPGKNEKILNVSGVESKWGCDILELPWLRAMVGDSSDNIKGVEGVGPARGKKVLSGTPPWSGCYKPDENRWSKKVYDNLNTVFRNVALMTLPPPPEHGIDKFPTIAVGHEGRDLSRFLRHCDTWEIKNVGEFLTYL